MNLTTAQHTAVHEHDRNLVVVAGAGSGKTRVLVERYLALLDNNPDWPLNALVAITFTRKAAQEMRDRVRQALENRLRHASEAAAQRVWAGRLAAMDSARIDTIHGLCATILRANAAEAGIDPGFVVMDEVEAGILLDTVIDTTMQQVVEDDDLALALFAEYDRRSIESVLRRFVFATLPELPGDLFEHWQAEWETATAGHLERLRQDVDFQAALAWEPVVGWPQDDKLFAIWQACFPHFDTLLDSTASASQCVAALAALGDAIKVNVGSQANWGGKEILTEAKDSLKYIRASAQAAVGIIGDPPGPLEAQAAKLLPLWVRLIQHTQAAYRDAKNAQGLLDFDDLEQITRDLLLNYPQVRRRYQNAEFRHVLVDEFQDTNQAQWDIVRSLADPQQPGCLFVVGDQKQSIYAFRGADVSVFGQVRQTLSAVSGDEIALARSFRTHQPLVNTFNAVFDRILARDAASPVYEHEIDLGQPMDAQRLEAPSPDAALELLLVDTTDVEFDQRGAENMRRWEAFALAQRLQEMVEAQTLIYDKEVGETRPVRYDDMALLFQSMSHVTLYEAVFKAQGLPFVTVAGRGYYSRQEVWDLLNLLKALYNPADNLSLASALRSPLFGLSDDALLALRLVRAEDGTRLLLWDALDQPAAVPDDEVDLVMFSRDCLYALATLAGRVTIAELLRETLNQTGYLATLTGLPDGARRRGNVEKLLTKAESSGKITLGAFEQYLSDLSAREVREGEAVIDVAGAVTLMTVHASKGLEYPVVALVDSSWRRGNTGSDVLMSDPDYGLGCKVYDLAQDKLVPTFSYRQADHLQRLRDEAERKRLLYVAATRAQDYLLVSGQVRQARNGAWSTAGWLGWWFEALALEEVSDGIVDYDWGPLRIHHHTQMPPEDVLLAGEKYQLTAWDRLRAGEQLPANAVSPPLLAEVVVDPTAAARHLAVTQIADLGAQDIADFYGERFRRQVFQDAPVKITSVTQTRRLGRIIGEMVHEALRWWQPGQEALDDLLASYAWEQGVVDPVEQQKAVEQAEHYLNLYQQSSLYKEIAASEQVYREVPFIYDNGKRIIHGIIDVLFQRPDGTWALADYKTSYVGPNATAAAVEAHAQRFYMQVGAYAGAVLEQLKLVDDSQLAVYIHYIRHSLTVQVEPEAWRSALAQMEPYIGRVVGN